MKDEILIIPEKELDEFMDKKMIGKECPHQMSGKYFRGCVSCLFWRRYKKFKRKFKKH